MPAARLPENEQARVDALHRLHILDTGPEAVFDALTELARSTFDVPVAALSLVDTDRQWFMSAQGWPVRETPRDTSFCTHAILHPHHVTVVPDAKQDERFADNPSVVGPPGLRFYAGAPLTDRDGHVLGTLCVAGSQPRAVTDLEIRKLQQLALVASAALHLHGCMQAASRLALTDPLTGLANRAAFDAELGAVCAAFAKGTITDAALLMFDLDGFKGINDVFGHPGGDLALQEVGRRLQKVVRSGDRAFRLGGDEFALICPGMGSTGAYSTLADRIHASMADTFMIDGQTVPLRTSIGVAALPDHAGTPQELVHLADVALYDAKHAGRGTTRQASRPASWMAPPLTTYPDESERRNLPGIGLMSLTERLRQALVPGGAEPFTLMFQPVVALSTQRTSSLEALIRWEIGPNIFVRASELVLLAERLGLISHLDRWVLAAACKAAAAWPEPWLVSVNVSALSFGLIDVAAMVKQALATSGLCPARLIVEMTETALAGDTVQARKAVEGIRALGARVSLDDFGAGHGSLTTLRQFPFTGLKIDRTLIEGICTDPLQAHMVRLIAEFGHALGLRVVAEGVETADQLRAVTRCGVSLAQGYLLARPAAAADVAQAVAEADTNTRAALADLTSHELTCMPKLRRSLSSPTHNRWDWDVAAALTGAANS